MAGIEQVLENVQTALATVYPTLAFGLGTHDVDWGESPPRIVWIVAGAKHGPSTKLASRQRSLLTRNVDVVAYVWGPTLEDLEMLVEDTISAILRVAHGSAGFDGEDWSDIEGVTSGVVARLKFSIASPVVERRFVDPDRDVDTAVVLAAPTTIEHGTVTSTPGDGVIEWGET